jgi:hypothetical protein
LALDRQDGQQGIAIIGPAGVAFGQIDRWSAPAALLQLPLPWAWQHQIEIGDPAQGGKIQTTPVRSLSQEGLKTGNRLRLSDLLQASQSCVLWLIRTGAHAGRTAWGLQLTIPAERLDLTVHNHD